MIPLLVMEESPCTLATLLDLLGTRQVHRRSSQSLSQKADKNSRGLSQIKGAESLTELRPLSCAGLEDPYNQLTRSAGRM